MDVWYKTATTILSAYVTLFIKKVYLEGKENIPTGSKIVVANHALASDAFMLPFVLPEKLHCLIMEEAFSLPVLGKILARADQIPVVPGRGQEAIAQAKEKLDQGATIVLFPEGKLNDGKKLLKAYTGAARLAIDSGAPVLPIGFYTPPRYVRTHDGHMYGRRTHGSWQLGGPIFLSIGKSWRPQLEEPHTTDPRKYAKMVYGVTDEIMGRIDRMVDRARLLAEAWFPALPSGAKKKSS